MRAEPQPPFVVLQNLADDVHRQSLLGRDPPEDSILEPQQSAAKCSRPENALRIRVQGINRLPGQRVTGRNGSSWFVSQRYNVPSSAPAQTVPSGVSAKARTAAGAAASFVPKIRRSSPAHSAMPSFVPIHTRPAWSVKMDLMPCTSHDARRTWPSLN